MAKVEDIMTIAKRYANKKTILALSSSLAVLAITILSSIPNFMIDPSQIATSKFVTKLIMTLIIGVTNLVCFTVVGGTSNSLNKASNIYRAKEDFRKSAKDIIDTCYAAFRQWVMKVRRPAKQLEVNTRLLRHVGITNLAYLDLDECTLRDLMKAPNKELGDKYGVRQITQDQFEVIMSIKNGKTALKFLNPDDYLLEKTMGIDQTDEEVLIKQFTKRNLIFGEEVGSKILVIIVIAITLGCIGWSTAETMGEGDISETQRNFTIAWDILSKVVTAITSAFVGFFDGGKFNDFDAMYLMIKINIHSQFKADKDFKPLTEQELAREEYIKYHQQQEEENRKQLGLDVPMLPTQD